MARLHASKARRRNCSCRYHSSAELSCDNGGGGGGGSGDPTQGVMLFTTPNGRQYSMSADLFLQQSQTNNLNAIVDYGVAHGFNAQQIEIAVKQGFNESAFGLLESNPNNPNVHGMFQYDQPTWDYLQHGSLNLNSESDQIHAMYDDITSFQARYVAGEGMGSIPSTVNFEDYVELKHHGGPNFVDWSSDIVTSYHGATDTRSLTYSVSRNVGVLSP